MKWQISKIKTYFLILNIVLAVCSFSFLISAQIPGEAVPGAAIGILQALNQLQQSTQETPSNSPVPAGSGILFEDFYKGNYLFKDGSLVDARGNPVQPGEQQPEQPEGSKELTPGEAPEDQPPIGQPPGGPPGGPGDAPLTPKSPGELPKKLPEQPTSPQEGIKNFLQGNLIQDLLAAAAIGGVIGVPAGTFAGGEKGPMWGFISGFAGAVVYQIASKIPTLKGWKAALAGIGVALAIFLLTYKKAEEEKVEFQCLAWQPPIGGRDCESCNKFEECTEYTCKSLGQACGLVNEGTNKSKCVWINPHDTNSPIIKMLSVSKNHKFGPDKMRPTGTEINITQEKE
jgi:hypothetical protein